MTRSESEGPALFGAGIRRGRRRGPRRQKARPVTDRPKFDVELYERLARESSLEPQSVRETYAETAARLTCAMRELTARQAASPDGLTGDEHRALASYSTNLRKVLDALAAPAKAAGANGADFGEEDHA